MSLEGNGGAPLAAVLLSINSNTAVFCLHFFTVIHLPAVYTVLQSRPCRCFTKRSSTLAQPAQKHPPRPLFS